MRFPFLSRPVFDSKIRSGRVTKAEKWIGFFVSPVSVMLMSSILSNYLNVYYTDVLGISGLWGGFFIGLFPLVAKVLNAVTFVLMGRVVDATHSAQGKARPWILLSAPVLVLSMVLLFVVPKMNDAWTSLWIFTSYLLFYAVAYTAYNTAHTLLVPLASSDPAERSSLSLVANASGMLTGVEVCILFPCFIVPAIGINKPLWILVITVVAATALPLLLMEYYFTRERVTEQAAPPEDQQVTLKIQLQSCLQSRN